MGVSEEQQVLPTIEKAPPICTFCTKRRILGTGLFVAAIVTVAAVINGLRPSDVVEFFDDDPFDGTVYEWSPAFVKGNFLSIAVVNALEERYHPYFDLSVAEWEGGSPDVLTLRIRTENFPDSGNCPSARGTLRVCNGNYGDTGWKGLNEILLNGGKIVSSVALMNDYYMDGSSSHDQEYIMCHELGHGFGLPHTDERYWNLNQGNCMDYTIRPRNNRKPGQISFDRLAMVYGPHPSMKEENAIAAASQTQLDDWTNTTAATNEGADNVDGDEQIDSEALEAFDKIVSSSGDKSLQEYEEIDIGSGYSVVIQRFMI